MLKQSIPAKELARLAKRFRKEVGKNRAQAARDMGVSQASLFHAEESPSLGLVKLRIRMIEAYSGYSVKGPMYFLEEK